MSKIEKAITQFTGINNNSLIMIAIILLILCTDILDDLFEDNIHLVILIIFLIFNVDNDCYE